MYPVILEIDFFSNYIKSLWDGTGKKKKKSCWKYFAVVIIVPTVFYRNWTMNPKPHRCYNAG